MRDSQLNLAVYLPVKSGSTRIHNKSLRPFLEDGRSLFDIKITQLQEIGEVSKIIVSTDEPSVLQRRHSLGLNVEVYERDPELCKPTTSTDQLIAHAAKLVAFDHILWTHVTSPFVEAETYSRAIAIYQESLAAGYDSLMAVKEIRGFVWNEHTAITYDRSTEKWPRTQTINPIYEVTSSIFIASREIYLNHGDRIGTKVKLLKTSGFENIDIDWQEDFELAQTVAKELQRL